MGTPLFSGGSSSAAWMGPNESDNRTPNNRTRQVFTWTRTDRQLLLSECLRIRLPNDFCQRTKYNSFRVPFAAARGVKNFSPFEKHLARRTNFSEHKC